MNTISQKYEIRLSPLNANVLAIVLMLFLSIGFGGAFAYIWDLSIESIVYKTFHMSLKKVIWVIADMFTLAVLHELIHGVFWAFFCRAKYKSIKFGFNIKFLAPYCHCKEQLEVRHYIIGALAPSVVLGIFPLLLGLMVQSIELLIIGVFGITIASGDFLIINKIGFKGSNRRIKDLSDEPGCLVYN